MTDHSGPETSRSEGNEQRRSPKMTRGKRIVFTLILVAGMIGFVEAIASIYYFNHYSEQYRAGLEQVLGIRGSAENTVLRYVPHPYFNYICNPDYRYPDGYQPHNSRGFRKPEWPIAKTEGTLRIVALGGSTTYGIFAKRGEEVWPALLQAVLRTRAGKNVEVFNLGVAAYTTSEIIGVAAMMVPTLDPDAVLIHVGANEAFAAAYPDEGGPDNTGFRHVWSHRSLPSLLRFAMRRSYAIRVTACLLTSRRGYVPGDIIPVIQYPHPDSSAAARHGAEATGKYFRSNVSAIIAMVMNMGALPVLITHPLNPRWRYPDDPFYKVVTEAHMRNNQILTELAVENRVPLVALHDTMSNGPYFLDAIHMSKPGMKRKADLIADHLSAWLEERARGEESED